MSPLKIKDFGVIYSPEEITTYLCRNTIIPYILDQLNEFSGSQVRYQGIFGTVLEKLDHNQLQYLLNVIKNLKILDPAVGTGQFLLEALFTLKTIYDYMVIKGICDWNKYQIIEWIITQNLYGVDISQAAIEECKSRLSSVLFSAGDYYGTPPDLGANIRCGNSLIGFVPGKSHQKKIIKDLDLKPFHWNQEFREIFTNGGFDICLGNPPWNIYKPLSKEFFAQYNSRLTKYGVDKKEAKEIIAKLLEHDHIKEHWNEYEQLIRLTGNYFRSENYCFQSDQIVGVNGVKTISGDLNLYKLFLERIFRLMRPKGYCGVIIPSGFHTDAGTKGLRRLLFEKNTVKELHCFENRRGIFPSIHRSFKFDLLIFKKSGKTESFNAAFMLHDPDILKTVGSSTISIIWESIKRLSPSSWSILEFKTPKDIDLAIKMYKHPPLRTKVPDSWKVRFTRELDITLDNKLFNTVQQGVIIYEGKMIEQYTHQFKKPRYWIKKENVLTKFGSQYKDFKEYRLGFRAVAASTNRRTMIATIIPQTVCCGNSLIVTKIFDQEKRLLDPSDLLYLCGVFNSFVFDFLLRLKVSTNLNMFFIYDMPVPRLSQHDKVYQEIVSNVAALFPEFAPLSNQFAKGCKYRSFLDRIQCQATIDSLVAKIYELDEQSIEYILDQFHQKDPRKEEVLNIQKNAILARFS
ncbi:MAG: Eco57I restriction-modification methylase domain-containing protein [Candidatus Hodarchaeales archaeon]|jgi:Alw26I/Eco31I/Esp3I family type II restriction m6 adenine DNA methyltransferase